MDQEPKTNDTQNTSSGRRALAGGLVAATAVAALSGTEQLHPRLTEEQAMQSAAAQTAEAGELQPQTMPGSVEEIIAEQNQVATTNLGEVDPLAPTAFGMEVSSESRMPAIPDIQALPPAPPENPTLPPEVHEHYPGVEDEVPLKDPEAGQENPVHENPVQDDVVSRPDSDPPLNPDYVPGSAVAETNERTSNADNPNGPEA